MKAKLLFQIGLGLTIIVSCTSEVRVKNKKVNEDKPWSIVSTTDWKASEASSKNVILKGGVILEKAGEGSWTSVWHDWNEKIDSAKIMVSVAGLEMFLNPTIETIVKGSKKPFTDADGVEHDWYGRCMIVIVDSIRWIMAIRSGTNHIDWTKRDAIHLLTSTNEGRTWGKLNKWFDGTPIQGMPYEDGESHSEPGIYKMPNGDIILQFWRKNFSSGTKQMRSTDNGKTWITDLEQVNIKGAPDKVGDIEAFPIGTQNFFVDPENPNDIYMAFEYYFGGKPNSGTILARSTDNCKTYSFLSWILPKDYNNFEPAIEYIGNRTIIAVVRDQDDQYTWQTKSTDMGATFSSPVDISEQINGGVPNGLWQRPRLYKESNPNFQFNNRRNYANGEGLLWGFGIHTNGYGTWPPSRKPVVYWSDNNGKSWHGPQLLHGPMYPGTDTGYGDMVRRTDGTFVAATYYAGSREWLTDADVEQYTFFVESARIMIETDKNSDGVPEPGSTWIELYNGHNIFSISDQNSSLWRIRLLLSSNEAGSPRIYSVKIMP